MVPYCVWKKVQVPTGVWGPALPHSPACWQHALLISPPHHCFGPGGLAVLGTGQDAHTSDSALLPRTLFGQGPNAELIELLFKREALCCEKHHPVRRRDALQLTAPVCRRSSTHLWSSALLPVYLPTVFPRLDTLQKHGWVLFTALSPASETVPGTCTVSVSKETMILALLRARRKPQLIPHKLQVLV